MLFYDFLAWWYGPGWLRRMSASWQTAGNWLEYFSIGLLLKTLFQPWRQNISIARPDQSLNDKFTALLDNLVSRVVGFMVRTIVLFVGLLLVVVVFVVEVLFFIAWPLLPLSPIILFIAGVIWG